MYRFVMLLGLFAAAAQAVEPISVTSAGRQTAVVELYTSEGCSSCPPADRWLARLVEVPRKHAEVLALSFHVDYWNYLGWRDRFSSPAFTSRQRELGANNSQRTIYTPEFFVNGREARGSGKILDLIAAANRAPAPIDIELLLRREGGKLLLELRTDDAGRVPAQHRYLVYEDNLSTEVERGENRGRRLEHQRVVRYMSRPYGLQSHHRHRIEIDPEWDPRHVGVAVLVTTPGSRDYLQAVHTPVSSLLLD